MPFAFAVSSAIVEPPDKNSRNFMRFTATLLFLLPLLVACSDGSDGPPEQGRTFAFQSYQSAPQPRGGECLDSVDVAAPLIVNGFGFNHANTRNQDSLLDASNIGNLATNFVFAPAGVDEKRGAPAATAQAIFLTSGTELLAINRHSGCTYWSFDSTDTPSGNGATFRSASILYEPAMDGSEAAVFAADFNGNVYAVNARTGKLLWERFVGTIGFYHFVTGGMQYHAGKLLVPVSSKEVLAASLVPGPCCISHGMLLAMDAGTGDTLWEYHTTADATQTIVPGSRIGPNGATIWGTPTLDTRRGVVYVGTGQNYSEPITETSDAIISLNIENGQVNWIFQARDNDAWNGNCSNPDSLRCADPKGFDFDFGAAPILVDGGNTVIAGDKGGIVYSIDAQSGVLNWSTRVSRGSTLGGIHWGMAVDQSRIYVAATDFSIDKASGGIADLIAGAMPGIYALDIISGEIDWEIHPTHMYEGLVTPSLFSASLSVTNDLLLAGSLDGVVRAFDTRDGRQLWSFNTAIQVTDINGIAGQGGTIDSVGVVVAGDSLLINSGYSTFQGVNGRYQRGPGNALFVLALPD